MTPPRFDDLSFKKMALVINQSVFRRTDRNDERRSSTSTGRYLALQRFCLSLIFC